MQASEAQTPTGKGFDTYFGYFDGYNDYLHSLSGTVACPNRPGTVTFRSSAADGPKCTGSSVIARHLTSATDLWLNDHPAHGLNGTGFEEALFLERVLGLIAGHDPKIPFYLYYPMHLVHSPLCVPAGYLEKFAFIADADDDKNHDRQFVAAMVNYLDDVVGNIAQALKDAGMWEKTLMVWSSGKFTCNLQLLVMLGMFLRDSCDCRQRRRGRADHRDEELIPSTRRVLH